MKHEAHLGRDTWIVRLACLPGTAAQLAGDLSRRPDTQYIDLVSGGSEVVCAMTPRTRQDRDQAFLDRLQPARGATSVSASCILRTFYGGSLGWLRKINALTQAQEAALRAPIDPDGALVALDDLDEALLAALHRDGRATLAELQGETGQSESVVTRRLQRLRGCGALYFAVEYDHEPLGRGVEAMLWLTVPPSRVAAVGQAVATHPEVRFAAAVTGRANLALSVLCRTTDELYFYLTERLGSLPGIAAMETSLILRRIKTLG
ncbi:Lrp/AsnC family transcriptional regulator [Actinospica durhamensis]|uniref:Lrp/AsnC family transcriptional regulator n=1 Tax=Actinospica durhamensis TaxID=1508375 RepID=A0A941EZ95_9ACTN|nr:Lrp/AsnC family transcriptional regulator [Actinospica durhamensis]MBR7839257.1 Lrp/AsnC family transcriptional regulator [Actinospica durhamensis]